MKFIKSLFTVTLLLVLLLGVGAPFTADAQPTPSYTTSVVSDALSSEYIEYKGTITMYADSSGSHYSKPFSINRIAGQAGTLRFTTSNPQDADSINVRIRVHTTYDIDGDTLFSVLPDSTTVTGSGTTYLKVGGSAFGVQYNNAYWAVIEAKGIMTPTTNWDSTSVSWQYRGYRTVASTRQGQVKN